VCLEDDLIGIFRLTSREMRFWRQLPELIAAPDAGPPTVSPQSLR